MILSTCSSRGRPQRCRTMIESWLTTVECKSRLMVYVDEQDLYIDEYEQLAKLYPQIVIGPHLTLVQVLNLGPSLYPDMRYYHEINDDHRCVTPGWDRLLSETIGDRMAIAYGQTRNLPSSLMMSGDLVRALGYFAYPAFAHLYVDNFFRDLGQDLGGLIYVPEVLIEHEHYSFGLADKDAVYETVYSAEYDIIGRRAYQQWLTDRYSIVERILNG